MTDRAGECNAGPIPLVAEREVAEVFEFMFGKPERGLDWMDMVWFIAASRSGGAFVIRVFVSMVVGIIMSTSFPLPL